MATNACAAQPPRSKPSRFTRALQRIASLAIAVLALLTGYIGAINLFFYLRDVERLTDWLLLLIGTLTLLLAVLSLFRPHRTARTLSILAVIGFSCVAATAFHVLPAVSSDANISIMAAASYFVIFLLSRYLARDHAAGDNAACNCGH